MSLTWGEIGAIVGIVLTVLAALRIVLTPFFDKVNLSSFKREEALADKTIVGAIERNPEKFGKLVIQAMSNEAPAWQSLAKAHFPELFSAADVSKKATEALAVQASEIAELREFVQEQIKPLATLPMQIEHLVDRVTDLGQINKDLGKIVHGLDKTVGVLQSRLGVRSTDLPGPSER